MTPSSGPDLACFGYLAYAHVTTVASYPRPTAEPK